MTQSFKQNKDYSLTEALEFINLGYKQYKDFPVHATKQQDKEVMDVLTEAVKIVNYSLQVRADRMEVLRMIVDIISQHAIHGSVPRTTCLEGEDVNLCYDIVVTTNFIEIGCNSKVYGFRSMLLNRHEYEVHVTTSNFNEVMCPFTHLVLNGYRKTSRDTLTLYRY